MVYRSGGVWELSVVCITQIKFPNIDQKSQFLIPEITNSTLITPSSSFYPNFPVPGDGNFSGI